MTGKKINLKEKQIIPEKKEYMEKTVINLVKKSTARHLFKSRPIQDSDLSKGIEFYKLGMSSITNKEWYVDMGDDQYYSIDDIPRDFVDAIKEGELKGIIEKILSIVPEENKIEGTNFDELLEESISLLPTADLIISNLKDGYEFYYLRGKFDQNYPREHHIIGKYLSRKVAVSRVISTDINLVIDTNRIGELIIKKDISANLDEIHDREKVKKDLPEMTDEKLDNRVRFLIEEVLTFHIKDPKAVIQFKFNKHQKH